MDKKLAKNSLSHWPDYVKLAGYCAIRPVLEALLLATACSKTPAGCARWTLKLLAGRMVELTERTALSEETISRRLHANELKR